MAIIFQDFPFENGASVKSPNMTLSLIAGATCALGLGLACWRWRFELNRKMLALLQWLSNVFFGSRFLNISATFCAEAAVLISVFPVLDRVAGPHSGNITWPLVAWSFGLAIGLMIVAGILSAWADRRGKPIEE